MGSYDTEVKWKVLQKVFNSEKGTERNKVKMTQQSARAEVKGNTAGISTEIKQMNRNHAGYRQRNTAAEKTPPPPPHFFILMFSSDKNN